MQTDQSSNDKRNNDKTDSDADAWKGGLRAASAVLASALDATVSDEKFDVVGKYAIPASLDVDRALGQRMDWGDDVKFRSALRQAWSSVPEDQRGMSSKDIKRGKAFTMVGEAIVGMTCAPEQDKKGNDLCLVRDEVVELAHLYGGEDCASNLEAGASDDAPPRVTIPTDDGPVLALVPSGAVSGPCIAKTAFVAVLRLFSATGKVSAKIPSFLGLVRKGNGIAVTSFVTVEAAFETLVRLGIRTAGAEGSQAIVVPTVNGKLLKQLPEDMRATVHALGSSSVEAYLEAAVEAANTILGGGKPRKSANAARAVATGAAYAAALKAAGMEKLAEGAAQYGHISAITGKLSVKED